MAQQTIGATIVAGDQVVALNLTADEWVNSIRHSMAAARAMKVIHYYDGEQKEELVKVLDDPYAGRLKWRERGFIPRCRNWTKHIVSKSALLFNYPPAYALYQKDEWEIDDAQTLLFEEIKSGTDWDEFWNGFDKILRVMKTALVYQSYDAEEDQMIFDILHRGNSWVVTNGSRTRITGVIRVLDDEYESYQICTEDEYIYLTATDNGFKVSRVPNPYYVVPASVFHDVDEPRTSFWNTPGYDLTDANEMYNLAMTDSEMAISWSKLPTPITNADVAKSSGIKPSSDYDLSPDGTALSSTDGLLRSPVTDNSEVNVLGGPSRPVKLIGNGIDTPFLEYKTPTVNIGPLDEVVNSWMIGIANDWSVRIKTVGSGSATSGFQLVVEEMDNLELRQERARMFQVGFKRFFPVFAQIYNTIYPGTFSDDVTLFVEFPKPRLPVDLKVQEDVWSVRINEGRATEIDYFIDVFGMTREEAIIKYQDILEFNALKEGEIAVAETAVATDGVSDPVAEENDDGETEDANQDQTIIE